MAHPDRGYRSGPDEARQDGRPRRLRHALFALSPDHLRLPRSLARRFTRRRRLLAQETFVRVLEQRRAAPPYEQLLPWLLRIARNLGIDRYRRERAFLVTDDSAILADPGPIPLERLTRTEREEQLTEVLASIAPAHREVLLLRAVEGLHHRDIALTLGCTEGSARERVHRATVAVRVAWHCRYGEKDD